MAQIIVLDDEADIRRMLKLYLEARGHEVREATGSADLETHLQAAPPDVVLVDLNLPGESGLRIARRLRECHDCAILMLTGMGEPTERVIGLEIGADDYLVKPVHLPELTARIEAVLRRRRPHTHLLPFGPYRFDLERFRLLDTDGNEVPLGGMELDLVAAFSTRPGRLLRREELLRLAPPRTDDPFDRSIDNRIIRLRRKLERHPDKPELIKTVRGGGYIYPGPASADGA